MSLGDYVISISTMSAGMVGVGVVAPAVMASGYGEEGAAVVGVAVLLYWLYRMFFGKEEADDLISKYNEKAGGKPKPKSK